MAPRPDLHRLFGLDGAPPDPTSPPRRRPVWREFRSMLYAVVIAIALFMASYLLLDLEPVSKQERAELFQFTAMVPVFLEMCAERLHGDPEALRRASLRATAFLQAARDRSAEGLIAVPPGTSMDVELEQRAPAIAEAVRQVFIDAALTVTQWQRQCAEYLADVETPATTGALLARRFPNQVRKLGLGG